MISIIIPTLNEAGTLGRTLSALKSGLRTTSYEIIISDGGSTDGTREIAQRSGARVVTEADGRKQTIARGRNLGAAAATGEYLVFMDADVIVPDADGFFARIVGQFVRDPRLVGMTVRLKVLPESETLADRLVFGCVTVVHTLMNNVLRLGSASGEFQMIRTSAFRQAGGYREDLTVAEDNELFSRLARIGRTRIDRGLMVFHTGRRAHKVGWPRLLWSWFINGMWVLVFKRSYSREWKQVRSE